VRPRSPAQEGRRERCPLTGAPRSKGRSTSCAHRRWREDLLTSQEREEPWRCTGGCLPCFSWPEQPPEQPRAAAGAAASTVLSTGSSKGSSTGSSSRSSSGRSKAYPRSSSLPSSRAHSAPGRTHGEQGSTVRGQVTGGAGVAGVTRLGMVRRRLVVSSVQLSGCGLVDQELSESSSYRVRSVRSSTRQRPRLRRR